MYPQPRKAGLRRQHRSSLRDGLPPRQYRDPHRGVTPLGSARRAFCRLRPGQRAALPRDAPALDADGVNLGIQGFKPRESRGRSGSREADPAPVRREASPVPSDPRTRPAAVRPGDAGPLPAGLGQTGGAACGRARGEPPSKRSIRPPVGPDRVAGRPGPGDRRRPGRGRMSRTEPLRSRPGIVGGRESNQHRHRPTPIPAGAGVGGGPVRQAENEWTPRPGLPVDYRPTWSYH